jgi:hypothetical protein
MLNTNLATLALAALLQAAPALQGTRPVPDPALQAGIERLLAATDEAEHRAALAALEVAGGDEHERLVRELFHFGRAATDTREAMLLGVVLAELRVPAAHVVRALVPLLESDDARLRRDVGGVLSEYEDRSLDRGASFTVYRDLIAAGPTPGLARHLFETDPGAALLALAHAQVTDPAELRALLWAEHEVADLRWRLARGFLAPDVLDARAAAALRELGFLARHPRWWARLAAAEVARAEPALRAGVPLEELRRDEHALVRAAAAF